MVLTPSSKVASASMKKIPSPCIDSLEGETSAKHEIMIYIIEYAVPADTAFVH